MENLSKEQFSELINKYKESFYIICAGNGALKNNECAAYIAISQESAKKYFDSIIEQLPESLRNFSVLKMNGIENIYSFSWLFNRISFKYIYIVDFGIVEKGNFIKRNLENVDYIYEKLNGFNDNDVIYSVYTKENDAFTPSKNFRQCFFSNTNEVDKFIEQYNNESLGLHTSFFELDAVANGYYINDFLDCSFDGKECSGWDIVEAAYRIYNGNFLSDEEIKQIISNKKLAILVATDGSNYVMEQLNNSIFFTSNEQAEKFLERNQKNTSHQFELYTIEKIEAFENLISNSNVIYIDGEKHTATINFLTVLKNVNENINNQNVENTNEIFNPENWKITDEIQEKIFEEYIKISFSKEYSQNSYKLLYYVLEHFVRYARSTKSIRYYNSKAFLDFIKTHNENDFSDTVNSYTSMDNEIIDSEWKKTVQDMKEIANKLDENLVKDIFKNLRDLLFEIL